MDKLQKIKEWNDFFSNEFEEKYFQLIIKNINQFSNEIYPKRNEIFRIFELINPNDVKVVIFGQDPYHNENQANGVAFGVNIGLSLPPSLKNIAKEVYHEFNKKLIDYSLLSWVNQGVLLVNTIWTVFKNKPLSCHDWGWEKFSKSLLKYLYKKNNKIIFVCFGNWAYNFLSSIKLEEPIILRTSHPSPLSAYKGFIGSNIFKNINKKLKELNLDTIDWC